MTKRKAPPIGLIHIDIFRSNKDQTIRDLGTKHGQELAALREAHDAEYALVMGGVERQRKFDVVEAIGRYTAADLTIPSEWLSELGGWSKGVQGGQRLFVSSAEVGR